jgi:allantoicase
MDGWESRRKRTQGHDWCIIRLATSGQIKGVDIDTNHFLGNHPPFASIDAALINDGSSNADAAEWKELLPKSPLRPGSQNLFEIENPGIYTHLRLNIYPDGGVARLKVYGEVFRNWETLDINQSIDLAAALNGARCVYCNDMFFSHMENLIMPGRGINMGDGWETKRNRTPGNKDWVIVRLAHKGIIEDVLIDTRHFKGNYPDSCLLEGCMISIFEEEKMKEDQVKWSVILPQVKLQADHEHFFKQELKERGPFSHVRLTIFPDGGISRMRINGKMLK